jgi:hypothetical protein
LKESAGQAVRVEAKGKASRDSLAARLYLRARRHFPEMLQTMMDIGWIATDVAVNTRYNTASPFIDLVAGGHREFCDQPDLYYSAAFIDITRGREYTIRIGRSDAVCIHAVMTSHKDGVSTQTFWATRTAEEARRTQVIRICDSPNDPAVLDSSAHEGLCGTFVRLYFLEPLNDSKYEHGPVLEMTKQGALSRHKLPAAAAGTLRFLPIRETTVLWKFLSFKIGGANRKNNIWVLTNVDKFNGWKARIKEFLVNDCGRYFSLDLCLQEHESLEVVYEPQADMWASIAFVTPTTRTLSYMNLCNVPSESDGRIHVRVSPGQAQGVASLSTHGRLIGTVLLREVSTDGRVLSKDVSMPGAVIHQSSRV